MGGGWQILRNRKTSRIDAALRGLRDFFVNSTATGGQKMYFSIKYYHGFT